MATDKGSFEDIQWPPLLFSIIGFFSHVGILIFLFLWCALRYCVSCCCSPARCTPVLLSTASIPKKQMEKKKLVVILHGHTSTEGSLAQLITAICNEYKDVDILTPDRPGILDSFRNTKWFGFMGLFSTDCPDEVVGMIRSQIAEVWNPDKHESVVLVGHSIGAVLARRVYLSAWQEEAENNPISQGESN